VARNLHTKFGADWAVSEFFTIFSSKIRIQSDCRDVIDDVIEPSLRSDEFQGGKEPPRHVWHEWDSSRIFTIFSSSKHHPKRPP
jgi:hypothetical protein